MGEGQAKELILDFVAGWGILWGPTSGGHTHTGDEILTLVTLVYHERSFPPAS
jgi:hypothetical protein